MKALKAWAKALGIDPGTYGSWVNEAPKHENFTFWCLARGRIRSSDYFAWATDHYGLAMLTEAYFSEAPNRELWEKIQSVANWSPSMLPLEEWDGTIFVACVEPPQDIQWSFPVQYVLASPRDLATHWERLNDAPTRVNVRPAPASDEKAQFVVKTAPPPVPPPLPNKPSVPATDDISAAFMLNVPVVAAPKPQGQSVLELDLAPPPLVLEDTQQSVPVDQEQLIEEMPEGLAPNFNLPPKEAPPQMPALDEPTGILSSSPVPALNLPEEPPAPASILDPVTTPTASRVGYAPPPAVKSSTSHAGGPVDADRLAPTSLSGDSSEVDAIAWGFQQLKQHFKFSWLFMVQGDSLIYYCWESAVKATSENSTEPVDLTQPSLFRIVTRTRMPYHGHVVESPINTGFFKTWGLRQTPPHVTAIPLSSSGHLVAILVCAGDKPAQLDQVLRFAEKIGNTILSHLGKRAAAA